MASARITQVRPTLSLITWEQMYRTPTGLGLITPRRVTAYWIECTSRATRWF